MTTSEFTALVIKTMESMDFEKFRHIVGRTFGYDSLAHKVCWDEEDSETIEDVIADLYEDSNDKRYLELKFGATPKVGDLATRYLHTDSRGYDVIKSTGKTVLLRQRSETMVEEGECTVGGFAAHWHKHPVWETESDEGGTVIKATLRKNGEWKVAGWPTNSPGGTVKFGYASYFVDYNF